MSYLEFDTVQVLGTLRVMDELVLDPNTDDKSHRKDALQCLCFVNENDEKRSIRRTWGMVLLVKRNVLARSSIPWIIHNKAMINWSLMERSLITSRTLTFFFQYVLFYWSPFFQYINIVHAHVLLDSEYLPVSMYMYTINLFSYILWWIGWWYSREGNLSLCIRRSHSLFYMYVATSTLRSVDILHTYIIRVIYFIAISTHFKQGNESRSFFGHIWNELE